jgi:hypothetical protein
MIDTTQKNIYLTSASLSLKFIPIPVSSNNINPKLVLKESSIEYRAAFLTSERNYSEIVLVDVNTFRIPFILTRTAYIKLRFASSIFIFSGNLEELAKLKELVHILKKKGCPISDKAEQLLLEED